MPDRVTKPIAADSPLTSSRAAVSRVHQYTGEDILGDLWRKGNRIYRTAPTCDQKLRWNKRKHAEKAGMKLARRDERRGRRPRVRVYKCSECRGYHLTSMPLDVWLRRQPRWRRVLLWLHRLGGS